jgi:hypothetical protein
MIPADGDAPGGPPAHGESWTTAGAVLLLLTAIAHIAYGAAAIGGLEALQDNVRDIESNPQFGKLYLGLSTWGVLLVLAGAAEFFAGARLARRRPNARLVSLAATLPGLALCFFTLALFHGAALVTLALLLAALYVLSYRVSG